MVRRKTAASSVPVFRDDPDDVALPPNSDGDDNNDDNNDDGNDDTLHHLPPPRKKTRLSKEPPVAAPAALKTRRAALKEKATNPSSSDNSFLRPIDKHEPFHEKLQKGKSKTLPDSDIIKASLLVKSKPLLLEACNVAGPVHQALKKQLPAKELDQLLSLMAKDAAQDAADLIAKKGCWSPELLNYFRASSLTSLDLSSPASPSGIFIPHIPPGLTVQILFQQDQFSKLTIISFRNTPLLNDDVAFLRLLKSPEDIDFSNTGIGTQSLHHLVCHRHTLKRLNLSHNPSIDDDSRVALSAFPKLTALYLRGASFTMPGLRRLVSNDLPQPCRLLSIPAHCIDHLNTRQERYMVDIPTGYVDDPAQVTVLTMPSLKRNLELHARANRDVQVTGTKMELVSRLTVILSNRIADLKIVKVLGR